MNVYICMYIHVHITGKWCRVPNVPMHKLDSDHRGCFVLAFSTYGTFLACATGSIVFAPKNTLYSVHLVAS